MEWRRSGEDIFVRLDPGDEIHESLLQQLLVVLAEQETISMATWMMTGYTKDES
jgi:predicted DNA-binding protein with PD1-like motif